MVAPYQSEKQNLMKRLRRLEGQVRGVQKMIEEDKYCIDILTQITSISAANRQVGMIVLENHVNGCIKDAVKHKQGEEKINEMMKAVNRFIKS